MLHDFLIPLIILSFATAIQSVVGFGLALFAVPLLLMAGVPLLPSIFVVLSVSCLNALLGAGRLRGEIDIKKCLSAATFRMLGLIPGYGAALLTAKASPTTLKASIGLVVGLGVVAQGRKLLQKKKLNETPRQESKEPSRRWAPWAFLSSGFLMGWLGMGGPPLVFWLLSGKVKARQSRAFLYGIYLTTIPLQLSIMAAGDPTLVSRNLPLIIAAFPICTLVSLFTLKVGDKLEVERLQWWSLILLTLLSFKAIADCLLEVWRV